MLSHRKVLLFSVVDYDIFLHKNIVLKPIMLDTYELSSVQRSRPKHTISEVFSG